MGEESRVATDRASRSRSRTPFLRSSCDRELCNSAGGVQHSHHVQIKYHKSLAVVGESHDGRKTIAFEYKDSAFGTASVTGDVKALRKRRDKGGKGTLSPAEGLRPINGLYRNSKEQDISAVQKAVSRSISENKTSDYSSEEGENIVQEDRSAFLIYKKTGDWWNVFPKTDYTYSEYSPHRKEIAPGVVNMPNMSRIGLHSQDITSLTHDSSVQNRLKFSTSYDRTRFSSSYSKLGGDVSTQKWARVLGAEYASNESVRQDQITTAESRVWTKFMCVLLSLVHIFTSSVTRSMSSIHDGVLFLGSQSTGSSALSIRDMFLQWIYRVLGYVKILDTWLLLGWSTETDSVHTNIKDTYYQRLWTKLLKVFVIFLPTLLVAGCWAYVQIRDDQGVSTSIYIPEPNEPMLTSQSKSASGSVIQDFGSFSPLKFVTSSLAANFYMLWMWILYPLTKNQESEKKVGVQNVITPVSIIGLAENFNSKVEECAPSKVDMDDLVSKVVISPVFVSLLSSVKEGRAGSSEKLDSILAKMNLLQQQLDQKTTEIEMIKELIKKEVSVQFGAFSERKGNYDDALILETLRKLALRIDEISSQNKILENMINIESSSREKSLLSLRESLEKLKEQYSHQPSLTVSNELHNHGNFYQFKLDMMKYVDDQFVKYDADKTGIPDYALESSGGSIVSTRCTETYQAKTAVFSLFGIPLWSPSINPRKIIQPGILPGECWAFKGSQGFVVIKLSKKVHITKFSLEHTPKSLSPVGTIDSAPRNFSVWGLNSEIDADGQIFGHYIYDQNGPSLQYFPVERHDLPPYQFIELRIESNHGNLEYTCVYRFRVHGNVYKEENEFFGQHGN